MNAYPVALSDVLAKPPLAPRIARDADGIPVYRYGGAFETTGVNGFKYSKVLACWGALAALERGERAEFLRLARWVRDDLKERPDGTAAWDNDFDYHIGLADVKPPWTGAQGLGVGLSVLVRAHELEPASFPLDRCRKVPPLFSVPSARGGVLHFDERGELFGVQGADPVPAVFDGIAFGAIGLKDLHLATGDPAAAEAFGRVAESLRARLDLWDCHGGWSRMWIGGTPCSRFYHTMNVRTAEAMADLTGWKELRDIAERWARGLASPSVRTRAWVGEKAFFLRSRLA